MEICFQAFGNVQGVFFRKTICLAAKKRGFRAGATNNREDREAVICTVIGDHDQVQAFIDELTETIPLIVPVLLFSVSRFSMIVGILTVMTLLVMRWMKRCCQTVLNFIFNSNCSLFYPTS